MTSTSFINGTGLKKCRPATRSGFAHAAAIAVTDKRRRVGRKDASLADDGLERGEQRLLGIQALDDRFDHQIDAAKARPARRTTAMRAVARAASSSVSLSLRGERRQRRGDRAPRFRPRHRA